jgi:DNA-binding MarR family transcriptional regulator
MSSKIGEKEAIADALHSASIRLLRIVRAEDAHAGVGPAQLSALSVLVFVGAKTLSELAAIEQVRPPTMSRIVDGLVKQKLVDRITETADRRAVRITTTNKGRKLLLEGKARRVRALAKRLDNLTREELNVMQKAGEILARI